MAGELCSYRPREKRNARGPPGLLLPLPLPGPVYIGCKPFKLFFSTERGGHATPCTQCTRNAHAMRTQCTRNAHAMHTQCTYIYARVHTIIIANANAAGPLGAHHNPPNLSRFRFHISARSLSGERLPRTPSTSSVGRWYHAGCFVLFCYCFHLIGWKGLFF